MVAWLAAHIFTISSLSTIIDIFHTNKKISSFSSGSLRYFVVTVYIAVHFANLII